MEGYDVVVIGGGLGGLECGYILAKNGMKVCVLERHTQLGGSLQTFRRGNVRFDTGFHYVGGMGEGEPLHRLFRYFGLLDLPWFPLDREAFDEVAIGGKTYAFANGYERFADTLAQEFPRQRARLNTYAAFLKEIGEHVFDAFRPAGVNPLYNALFARSAYEFLNETIDDPLLRDVLSGSSLKMELRAETLPLYVFAQSSGSFIQSSWRLRGGGSQIIERLAQQLRAMGGEIRTRAEVTHLTESGGRLTTVEVNGQERLSTRWVVSGVHPAYTLALIGETKCLRPVYRQRIRSLENTFGMFTLHIRLKPGALPYRNRNLFVHAKGADYWHYRPEEGVKYAMVNYYPSETGDGYAPALDILTPMHWCEVEAWKDLEAGKRGEAYARLKADRAQDCIRLVATRIPELLHCVDKTYTSTPLSYATYTHAVEGSAYGVRKDCTRPMYTMLTPRTPIPNLLLTGQSLNLHGVLGVSTTAFFTCAQLLGWETLMQDTLFPAK
ncbi:MAG: NAD(P)/FAD-dependent oxidoreductase [Tannerella sp.]|jgi:all-trans-retinol 13,14-reductase|nr:NAD(P)/FAD-dependent oxidoreductase [Tannerella sp.]